MLLCRLFPSCGEWKLLLIEVYKLLIAVASLVEKHGVWEPGFQQFSTWAQKLQYTGLVPLSCSMACGIFPDQELNPCPLPCQAYSYPLFHQGNPGRLFLKCYDFLYNTVCSLFLETCYHRDCNTVYFMVLVLL